MQSLAGSVEPATDLSGAGRVTGVRGQRVVIAMMRAPDGHSRLELSRFDGR